MINNLQFYFADPWNPTANGEFRRVSVITPDCEALAPDVIQDYKRHEIRKLNTKIFYKKFGSRSRTAADQHCRDQGPVKT